MITDFVLPRRFSPLTLLNLVGGEENPPNLNMKRVWDAKPLRMKQLQLDFVRLYTICFTQPPLRCGERYPGRTSRPVPLGFDMS